MAKKKSPPKEIIVERSSFFDDLSPQAKQAIWAVLVAIVGVFFLAAIFDMSGPLGHYTFLALDSLFGAGAYLSPLACAFFVYILLNPKDDNHISGSKVFGIILFFLAILGLLEHTSDGALQFSLNVARGVPLGSYALVLRGADVRAEPILLEVSL